jgi:hypothetical protein
MVPAGTWPFSVLGWPQSLAGEPVTRGIEKNISGLQHPERWNARLRREPYEINRLRVGSGAFKREGW